MSFLGIGCVLVWFVIFQRERKGRMRNYEAADRPLYLSHRFGVHAILFLGLLFLLVN